MKKQRQIPSKQRPRRPHFRGLIIFIACVMALLFIVGVTSAASQPSIPSQKLQRLQALQHHTRIDVGTKSQIVKNLARPLPAQAAHPLQPGITQTRQGPFSSSFFLAENLWQGPLDNTWVLAYAGAKPSPDSTVQQGGILLYSAPNNASGNSDLHLLGIFLAPSGTSTLSIVSASGDLLHLHTEGGGNLTFDLQTYQYRT